MTLSFPLVARHQVVAIFIPEVSQDLKVLADLVCVHCLQNLFSVTLYK